MARPKLQQAIRVKGYSYQAFAKSLGVSYRTVIGWLNGDTKRIRSYYVPLICGKLGLSLEDLEDEPLAPMIDMCESNEEFEAPSEDQEEFEEPMELTRRKAASYTALIAAGIGFIPGTTILTAPVIAPDEFLAQTENALDTCWTALAQSNFAKVERTLNLHVPTLTQFANTESEHRQEASELSVQAMILLMMLAHRNLDYASRKKFGADAVRFGRISGNPLYIATALDLHGNTFIHCYHQPQKAIDLFKEALNELGSDASLNRSSLYSQLSIAYSMIKDKTYAKENEKLSRDYAKLARNTMPTYPESDPLYRFILMGTAELDQFEAGMNLFLARRFPGSDYGKLAYELFNNSLEKPAMNETYRSQAYIWKADAAIVQNKMHEFEESLRDGFDIAARINNQANLNKIHAVISHIPQEWRGETLIKTLQSDISQVKVVVACR
jgi:transcriptional regulator with XRE-family HTH domain